MEDGRRATTIRREKIVRFPHISSIRDRHRVLYRFLCCETVDERLLSSVRRTARRKFPAADT
jgi:hypothetical protein